MGFEIYFQVGVNATPEIPLQDELRAEFGETRDDAHSPGFLVVLDDGECWVSSEVNDEGRVVSFFVDRPTLDGALWAALYRLLTRFHYCSFWPAEACRPVVGRDDVEVDPEVVEALGPPRRVEDESDLPRWIREG